MFVRSIVTHEALPRKQRAGDEDATEAERTVDGTATALRYNGPGPSWASAGMSHTVQ
jgi:hypothetical protein